LPGEAKRAYLLRKGRNAARNLTAATRSLLWRIVYGFFQGAADAPSWLLRNVEEMNLHAARRYAPAMYPGRMNVFLSGDTPPGFSLDPPRDLDGLVARETDVYAVPGATHTMMKEPHVEVLSARLQACLDGARAGKR